MTSGVRMRRSSDTKAAADRSSLEWVPFPLALALLAVLGLPHAAVPQPDPCPEPVPVDVEGSPLIWRAEPDLRPIARALAENRALLAPLPGIGDPAAALAGAFQRPTVWILGDLGCVEAHGLAPAQPDWVAGLASGRGGYIALRAERGGGGPGSLATVFRHELAHLGLYAATDGRAPRWLQEGYAQYASGSWNWEEAWRLRVALLFRGEDALRELALGFPRDAEGARLAYLLSYTAVHELAAMGGERGLAAFFGAYREGGGTDAALRRVYGLTLGRFEERWRERVEARYGWLYVVSRASVFWVAVTLLLLWMGWRRRRRDRRRLEGLREAERREEGRGEEGPWEEGGWDPRRPPRGMA